jgi:hypothetical protein
MMIRWACHPAPALGADERLTRTEYEVTRKVGESQPLLSVLIRRWRWWCACTVAGEAQRRTMRAATEVSAEARREIGRRREEHAAKLSQLAEELSAARRRRQEEEAEEEATASKVSSSREAGGGLGRRAEVVACTATWWLSTHGACIYL